MLRDRREQILAQLLVILKAIKLRPQLAHIVRNTAGLPDERRPALILLDGDETLMLRREGPSRGLRIPPQLMAMTPQIFYLAGDIPENQTIGQHLNGARIAVIDAIINDPILKEICGNNGSIYYAGAETDMKTGSSMEGQMQINSVFIYPFIASELREGI